MVNAPSALRGIAKYLHDNEFHIRASLKGIYDGNTFGFARISERQQAAKNAILAHDASVVTGLHDHWDQIDDRRASAACLFEQFRARVWAFGCVFRQLSSDYASIFHVTFANTRDQCPAGALASFNLQAYRRRLRGALVELHSAYPAMWALGMVEVSAVQAGSGQYLYEPHFHVIANGVPANAIREHFSKLLVGSTKGSHGLMIKPVLSREHLGKGLSYLFKFEPELRTKFLTAEGRVGKGRMNRLKGGLKDEWLTWAAAHRIDELLINIGLWPDLMVSFKTCGLQRLIEELPSGVQQRPT